MRPKKIYLNPKTVGQLTPEMGEGKTMRVRAFKGKDDAEYTDLSQLWHDADKELPELMGGNDYIRTSDTLVVELRCSDGSALFPWPVIYVEEAGDAEGHFSCQPYLNVAPEICAKEDVVRWARLYDFRVNARDRRRHIA